MTSNSPSRGAVADWIDTLPALGRHTFTGDDARSAVGGTDTAREQAIGRLVKKRMLFQPHHGFFVIVPAEYRLTGSPPPLWYIDALMRYLERPYYVGLLSAAALWGAAHQQPQRFQVFSSVPMRSMRRGGIHIDWIVNKSVELVPIGEQRTPTGYVRVSSPAATALDLVRYPRHAGEYNNVATVLRDLVDGITDADMTETLNASATPAVAQRLGYLLNAFSNAPVIESVRHWLSEHTHRAVPLRSGISTDGARLDTRWRVFVNITVEPDLEYHVEASGAAVDDGDLIMLTSDSLPPPVDCLENGSPAA